MMAKVTKLIMFTTGCSLSMKLGATVRSQLMANEVVITRTATTTKDKFIWKSSPSGVLVFWSIFVRTTMTVWFGT